MRIPILVLLFVVVIPTFTCGTTPDAASREPILISPERLARQLGDPDLVLLHVGKKEEYAAAHLPGARHVAQADVSLVEDAGSGLHLEMLPADELRSRLQKLGISDRSRIVVYHAGEWITPATRIVFTLDYAGLGGRTSLLDGGLPAWKRGGHPVTEDVPAPRTGRLSPLKLRPLIVDGGWVKANIGRPGVAVVDARLPVYFDGLDRGGKAEAPHRSGHIAGARNVPFQQVTTSDGVFRTPAELRAMFERAGVKARDTVVAYCHNGQQATATLFAARLIGHDVRLYDGSFEEWSKQPGAPVEIRSEAAR